MTLKYNIPSMGRNLLVFSKHCPCLLVALRQQFEGYLTQRPRVVSVLNVFSQLCVAMQRFVDPEANVMLAAQNY
jgi:hypothetical protein